MPFAGYKNFAECVAKNKNKSDPEAYCATIMRKVEEGMGPKHAVEILDATEADFQKDESGKMTASFILIKAGRAANPRTYRPSALQKAAQEGIYNGTRMFVNHGDKPPLKRGLREMVSAVESTSWDPRIGDSGGIRGTAEIFDAEFFDYAQRAKKYMGVSANHQIQVQYVTEGTKTIQDVLGIPQAYSVDWVIYPSAGGEILSFARESEGADQVEWTDITLDSLRANAPQLIEQIKAELKPATESTDDPPEAPTAEAIKLMVTEGVQAAMAQMAAENTKRQDTSKKVRDLLAKSGLPTRIQNRIASMFADSVEVAEESVTAAITDAKEELKELGVTGPKITGEGMTGGSTGGKPQVSDAREGVEAIFGFKKPEKK